MDSSDPDGQNSLYVHFGLLKIHSFLNFHFRNVKHFLMFSCLGSFFWENKRQRYCVVQNKLYYRYFYLIFWKFVTLMFFFYIIVIFSFVRFVLFWWYHLNLRSDNYKNWYNCVPFGPIRHEQANLLNGCVGGFFFNFKRFASISLFVLFIVFFFLRVFVEGFCIILLLMFVL